jgi:hypothetical protein
MSRAEVKGDSRIIERGGFADASSVAIAVPSEWP